MLYSLEPLNSETPFGWGIFVFLAERRIKMEEIKNKVNDKVKTVYQECTEIAKYICDMGKETGKEDPAIQYLKSRYADLQYGTTENKGPKKEKIF
jgi:hypothetical protein